MFEILPNPSIETVMMVGRIALLIGAFWIFALAFSRWRRADERQMQQLAAQLQRTFAEVRSLHETVAVMSARLDSLGERSDTEARLAPAAGGSAQRGYDLAARLAKNGAAVDELVASCGITRHEAELLSRLHMAKSREAASTSWNMRAAAQEQPAPSPAQTQGRKRGSLLSVVS
jgi:hypothetical protein